MSTKLLNVIIGISLIGIIIIMGTQVFTQNYAADKRNIVQQGAIPSQKLKPAPIDALAECSGPYVNVEEGSVWQYALVSEAEESLQQKKKVITTKTIIKTSLTKKEPTQLNFSHQITTNGKIHTSTSQLICKDSGIYGLPIVLFDSTSFTLIPENVTAYITQNLLIIPNRRIYKGKEWDSLIDVGALLPMKLGDYKPGLHFKVEDEGEYRLPDGSKTTSLHIITKTNTSGPIDIGSLINLEYVVAEKVGLVSASLKASVPTKGNSQLTLSLTRFIPAAAVN